MMKISTRMRTTAPAISTVRTWPILLPARSRAAGVAADDAGAGDVGGDDAGAGGPAPLSEEGGKVVVCGACSVMALLSCDWAPDHRNPGDGQLGAWPMAVRR